LLVRCDIPTIYVLPMDVMMDQTNSMEVTKNEEGAREGVEEVTHSPRTPHHQPTDSMVTVPLSEAGTMPDEDSPRESIQRPRIIIEERRDSSRPSSSEILKAFGRRNSQESIESRTVDSPRVSVRDTDAEESSRGRKNPRRRDSDDSGKSQQVDWAELERKEEQEPEGEGQDKVNIAMNHT
jgi:hypothetical protein